MLERFLVRVSGSVDQMQAPNITAAMAHVNTTEMFPCDEAAMVGMANDVANRPPLNEMPAAIGRYFSGNNSV